MCSYFKIRYGGEGGRGILKENEERSLDLHSDRQNIFLAVEIIITASPPSWQHRYFHLESITVIINYQKPLKLVLNRWMYKFIPFERTFTIILRDRKHVFPVIFNRNRWNADIP